MVEGPSEKLFFDTVRPQLISMGISLNLIVAADRGKLIRNATKHLRAAAVAGFTKVCFLLDQDMDVCPPQTAELLSSVRGVQGVVVSVAARELEAWILADPLVQQYLRGRRANVGQTDSIHDPKEELFRLFQERYLYAPTAVAAVKATSPRFSFSTARSHNRSLDRFLNRLQSL